MSSCLPLFSTCAFEGGSRCSGLPCLQPTSTRHASNITERMARLIPAETTKRRAFGPALVESQREYYWFAMLYGARGRGTYTESIVPLTSLPWKAPEPSKPESVTDVQPKLPAWTQLFAPLHIPATAEPVPKPALPSESHFGRAVSFPSTMPSPFES